jgi:hypothetical protein
VDSDDASFRSGSVQPKGKGAKAAAKPAARGKKAPLVSTLVSRGPRVDVDAERSELCAWLIETLRVVRREVRVGRVRGRGSDAAKEVARPPLRQQLPRVRPQSVQALVRRARARAVPRRLRPSSRSSREFRSSLAPHPSFCVAYGVCVVCVRRRSIPECPTRRSVAAV